METLVANCMELYHKPRKKMCGAVGIYSLITAVVICLGYNKLYFELKLPNGSVGQLLDVMDYISNSFLMPFISLLTSILIGWVIGGLDHRRSRTQWRTLQTCRSLSLYDSICGTDRYADPVPGIYRICRSDLLILNVPKML